MATNTNTNTKLNTLASTTRAAVLGGLLVAAAAGCGAQAHDVGPIGNGGGGGDGPGAAGSGMTGTAGGGTAGAAGGAAGAAGAAPPIDGCDGVALQQSGVLDLHLRSVVLTGAITLNGAPLPDQSGSRGELWFLGDDGRTTAVVALGATGAKSYALREAWARAAPRKLGRCVWRAARVRRLGRAR